jgi:hypothetical protein
LEKDFDVLDL